MGDIFNQRIHRLWSQGECIMTLKLFCGVACDSCVSLDIRLILAFNFYQCHHSLFWLQGFQSCIKKKNDRISEVNVNRFTL